MNEPEPGFKPPKMTAEEREVALREAERSGVNLKRLRLNLKLTPTQRLARLQPHILMISILTQMKRL